MKYRFNDRVLFYVDSGTLGPSDLSNEPTPISNPSSRLLLLLIAHYGEPVNREVIFKKVWDDYGMISSNNNLNQCVSKLRRLIRMMGIGEEVIATVPKMGFMLRREIQLEVSQEGEDQFTLISLAPELAQQPLVLVDSERELEAETPVESLIETDPDTAIDVELQPEPDNVPTTSVRKKGWRWGMAIALAGFVFILGIGVTMYTTNSLARQEVFLGRAGSCKVFMSTATSSGMPGPSLNRDLLDYVEQRKAECRPDEYLLVVRSNQVRSYISGVNRMFFVRCTMVREHRLEFCSGMENDRTPILQ
ncbi:transcriptional regulator [Serratia aquatilis]|uniref:Transcriptional regulator n=1 Tax=Serratia aquatilis TaxID=1737515 RepID=A0ABV6E8F9_9GAMM